MPGFESGGGGFEEDVCVPSRRVVVTGATGLLGRAVLREFQNNDWWVLGTGYRRARPRHLRCDLLDEEAVRSFIQDYKPDVIVHCAAERRPDVVERHTEAAVHLNVHATATVAKEAASSGAFLIYISSDYVFDGRSPPHGEDDAPNPLNIYGRSKLEGERETLRHCPRAVVLRVPVLYGEVECVAESAVTALWSRVQQGEMESCTLDHWQQRFPTDTRDVATVCRKIAERGLQDPSIRGIFHFSAKEQMTKYEMAVAMAQAFNLPSAHLIPLTEQPGGALRPENPQLECSRLEMLGLSVEPRPFRLAITQSLWPFLPDKRWRQTVFH
ncbi:methionine adenosyltransferase 2 subunit beta isoform X2 [Lampris incognitus]|uniref:methionine adenosyltransferase 2 subunit beta isoform X2 n=1 Tax=Lampris incognitus TaxID=2546036 RepID=UPI0024B49486|nr:methionine adenosyltransferase 2 subunit beta isoform X2 [Lampris incognitus]